MKRKRGRPVAENPASARLPNVRLLPEQLDNYKQSAIADESTLSAWVKKNLDIAVKRKTINQGD